VTTNLETQIQALYDAERGVRATHAGLLRADRAGLLVALRAEVDDALALIAKEPDEAALRLVRLATLLGDVDGGEIAVDALIDVLGCEDPEARHVAGQALEDFAFDRFKEVALGVERALARLPNGSPALSELPYLLAEIAEPGAVKLVGRFLGHADAEAVAAAIEALVEIGDPSATRLLAPLEKDSRQVQIDDEEGERVSLGDLAAEARQLLLDLDDTHKSHGKPRGAHGKG
jgi:HEAT repeat protein